MSIPDLNRTSAQADADPWGSPQGVTQTQIVGCMYCLAEGTLDAPEPVYHYMGTSYCGDHLIATLT